MLQPATDGTANPVAMAVLGKAQVVSADLALETRWPAWCTTALDEGPGATFSFSIPCRPGADDARAAVGRGDGAAFAAGSC
jgi:hypothetical protein